MGGGRLALSAGGESVGAVVPSWRVTWCWWSRWDPLWCAPQEFSAADSLHSRTVDGQWGVVNGVSPEVHHNLLCLLHIEGQIVSATPLSQLCHFLSVVRFIVVADETYHCCVISKLDDVVGAELGSAVMGQQREEQRAEHTALWGTCAQCGSARGVVADTDWLRSSG